MKIKSIFTTKHILLSALLVPLLLFIIQCSKRETPIANGAAGTVTHTPNMMDTLAVKAFLTDYFLTKNSLLLKDSNIADTTKRYFRFTNNADWSIREVKNIIEEKEVYKKSGISITKVQTKITVDSLKRVDSSNVIAKIAEVTSFTTDAVSEQTNENIVTEISNEHTMQLSTGANSNWIVTETTTNSNTRTMPGGIGSGSAGGRGPNQQEPLKNFSGSAAANFAIDNVHQHLFDYWEPTEPCYTFYNYLFSDCTNFISYALKAGGWIEDNVWYSSSLCIGSSHAWAGADPFRLYAVSSGRTTSVSLSAIKSLQLGDILSCDWEGDGSFDHSVMVTNRDTYGNIYLTYHSNNTLNILYDAYVQRATQQHSRAPTILAFSINSMYR